MRGLGGLAVVILLIWISPVVGQLPVETPAAASVASVRKCMKNCRKERHDCVSGFEGQFKRQRQVCAEASGEDEKKCRATARGTYTANADTCRGRFRKVCKSCCEQNGVGCAVMVCGDGVRAGSEQCDNGGGNSDATPDACRSNCTLPACGDGVTDVGEECDGPDDAACAGRCQADCRCLTLITTTTTAGSTPTTTSTSTITSTTTLPPRECELGPFPQCSGSCADPETETCVALLGDCACVRLPLCIHACAECTALGLPCNQSVLEGCACECFLPVCGDGVCDGDEIYCNCREDCGQPSLCAALISVCGDGWCDLGASPGERHELCPEECPLVCRAGRE